MSGELTAYSLSELSLFVVSILGVCGGLLGIFFKGISKSRCSNIKCCCGCLECMRKPPTAEELAIMSEIEIPEIDPEAPPLPIGKKEIERGEGVGN